jgi:uncharacterized protein with GYD domain
MPKYMIAGSYVGAGVQGLVKEGGTARVKAIQGLAESAGGKVDAVYYAFGDNDIYVICDLPDNQAAAAVALTVNSSGAAAVKTTVLMTPEEVDRATKLTPTYHKPGG